MIITANILTADIGPSESRNHSRANESARANEAAKKANDWGPMFGGNKFGIQDELFTFFTKEAVNQTNTTACTVDGLI